MHLRAALNERLDLTIIEPNETCVSLNDALLPDALVLQGDWVTLRYIFNLSALPIDGERNALDLHHSTLPIAASECVVNGINLHFEDELTLPLPPTLPSSVAEFVELVNHLNSSRGLQCDNYLLRPVSFIPNST